MLYSFILEWIPQEKVTGSSYPQSFQANPPLDYSFPQVEQLTIHPRPKHINSNPSVLLDNLKESNNRDTKVQEPRELLKVT